MLVQFLCAKDFGLKKYQIAKECISVAIGQEQACSKITRLFFRSVAVTMPMQWLLTVSY